jgi:hypothetical protein
MAKEITYRQAQKIIAAARRRYSSSTYRFSGLPAESEGDTEFWNLRELAQCGVERGGRWCVYVSARYGVEQDCIVDHFYVDFDAEEGGE